MDYPGRYILINPPSPETLQTRLNDHGKLDEAAIKATIDSIPSEAQAAEISNKVIINDHLESAAKALSEFIYAKDDATQENGTGNDTTGGEEPKEAPEQMQIDAPAAES